MKNDRRKTSYRNPEGILKETTKMNPCKNPGSLDIISEKNLAMNRSGILEEITNRIAEGIPGGTFGKFQKRSPRKTPTHLQDVLVNKDSTRKK